MSRAAMVTVIHVVDTLEPTQSLPPVAAIPRSACLSTASLRAWQGHGAVSYYKRRSPSLLQETQTHQSPVHPPHTHTPQYPSSSFNYICWGGLRDNTEAQSGQGTLKLFVFFLPSHSGDVYVYMPTTSSAEHSSAAHLPLVQDKVGF